jgi:hypothetical protein
MSVNQTLDGENIPLHLEMLQYLYKLQQRKVIETTIPKFIEEVIIYWAIHHTHIRGVYDLEAVNIYTKIYDKYYSGNHN